MTTPVVLRTPRSADTCTSNSALLSSAVRLSTALGHDLFHCKWIVHFFIVVIASSPYFLFQHSNFQFNTCITNCTARSTSKLTLDTLRPLPLFLGVTGPSFCFAADAFSPPISLSRQADKSSLEKLISRLSRNLNFFATNYAFMAMCTILVVALMHPGMLLYVGITWSLWWLHVVVIRQDVRLVIMNRDLNDIFTPKRRSWILTAWTVWVALAKCLRPSMKGMAISGALVLFHALMRDPSKLAANVVASRSTLSRGSSDSDDGSEVMVEREDAV